MTFPHKAVEETYVFVQSCTVLPATAGRFGEHASQTGARAGRSDQAGGVNLAE